jgi:hypothetical protein
MIRINGRIPQDSSLRLDGHDGLFQLRALKNFISTPELRVNLLMS